MKTVQPMSFKEWLWETSYRLWKTIKFIFSVNVIGGTLILLCTIVVSYSHSYALFDSSIGYNGLFAHLGVIIVEAMFLLSGYNIMKALKQDRRPGQASIYGFWIGAVFVAWSNVAASIEPEVYDYIYSVAPSLVLTTIKGLLLGLAPPTSLLISKQIIMEAWENVKAEEGGDPTTTPVETSTTKLEKHLETSNPSTSNLENRVEEVGKASSERGEMERHSPVMLDMEGGDVEKRQHYIGDMEKSSTLEVENTERKVEDGDGNRNLYTSTTREVGGVEKRVEVPSSDHTPGMGHMEKVETSTLQENRKVESNSRAMEDGISGGNPEVEKLENEKKTTLRTGSGKKKKPSPPSTLATGESSTIVFSPGDDPLEVALEIMKVEGKRPGRPRLMKAGMSEHTAKMTAKKLEQIQKQAS